MALNNMRVLPETPSMPLSKRLETFFIEGLQGKYSEMRIQSTALRINIKSKTLLK